MVNDRQALELKLFAALSSEPVDWRQSDHPVPYLEAVEAMERRVTAIASGEAPEQVWLLAHPAALHVRHQWARNRSAEGPLSAIRDRPWRPDHLSWPRPARRLCHAGSEAPPAGRSRLRQPALRNGSSARSTPSASREKGARNGSASGWCARTKARVTRIRLQRSACGSAVGYRSMASRSMSIPISVISPTSCPAVSPTPVTA